MFGFMIIVRQRSVMTIRHVDDAGAPVEGLDEVRRAVVGKVMMLGGHVAALPERTLVEEGCDFVARDEGLFALVDLLTRVFAAHPDLPVGIEVISDEMRALSASDAASAAAASLRRLLDRLG